MNIELTGRHIEITPAMREHVENLFGKLKTFLINKTEAQAHVVVSVEKNRQNAEIILTWREHTLTAKESDKDLYQALTSAADKLEKQARRLKDKVVDRKHHAQSIAAVAPEPDAEPITPMPAPPRIIETEISAVKPLTTDEALMQLNDGGNQFVVYRDAENERVSVLYKRADGNFGLIQP